MKEGDIMLKGDQMVSEEKHGQNDIDIEKHREFEFIINSEFDQVTVADCNGRIIRVYRNCDKIFGISENEMVGMSGLELEEKGILSESVTAKVFKEKEEFHLHRTLQPVEDLQ